MPLSPGGRMANPMAWGNVDISPLCGGKFAAVYVQGVNCDVTSSGLYGGAVAHALLEVDALQRSRSMLYGGKNTDEQVQWEEG